MIFHEPIVIGTKFCTQCRKFKPFGDFFLSETDNRRFKRLFGPYLMSRCKRCLRKDKTRSSNFDVKQYRRNWRLVKKFGITNSDYQIMLSSQLGNCAICGMHTQEGSQILSVDHDHKTNKVRGLLCKSCNQGIGFLRDDIYIMQKAIEYIRYHNA